MNLKSTLALLVILGALLLLYFWRTPDAPKGARESQKMVKGYDASRVARIRIENIERNEKILLIRIGDEWRMEEPVRVPADAVSARFLASYLADYDATPVGVAGDAPVKRDQLGLDTPRAIVEFEAEPVDSRPESKATVTKWTVKIGSDDLKGNSVFLQVGDNIYKAPRTIYNSVAKPPEDFRERRVFTLTPLDVELITITRGDSVVKLALEDGEWRLLTPFKGKCDAALVSRIVGLTGLRIESFENDLPSNLTPVGLDNPGLRVTLSGKGKSEELVVGFVKDGRTFIQRAGNSSLWSVESDSIGNSVKTAEELRDGAVFGAFSNESVESLHWRFGTAELDFARDAATRTVKMTRPREAGVDRDAFEAILKSLNGLKADAMVAAVGASLTDFGLSPPLGEVELKLKDAAKSVRLEVGATRPEGIFLRRPGDDYLLRVPASALLTLGKPFTDFVSRELLAISTYDAGFIELDFLDKGATSTKLAFEKNEGNKWVRRGEAAENKAFTELFDGLMHVKSTEVLAADPSSTPLRSPSIEIRVYRRLYNNPKGADKEKERLGTLRFAANDAAEWFGTGIAGSATTGGFAMKISSDVPTLVKGLLNGAESKPASGPESRR